MRYQNSAFIFAIWATEAIVIVSMVNEIDPYENKLYCNHQDLTIADFSKNQTDKKCEILYDYISSLDSGHTKFQSYLSDSLENLRSWSTSSPSTDAARAISC